MSAEREAIVQGYLQAVRAEADAALADRRLGPDTRKRIRWSTKAAENHLRAIVHFLMSIEESAEREEAFKRVADLILAVYGMGASRRRRFLDEVKAKASAEAKRAIDARHDRPGGARDKRARMLAIWAEGNFTTKQICAEQSWADLGISYDTARKALRGAPNPSPWPARKVGTP